ncbi:hypothetical protein [Paraburkholderia strydomiana]
MIKEFRPVGYVSPSWLGCYPIFQDELRGGETTFHKLPLHAKLVALQRTTADAAEQAIASTILDDVGASFVELSTGLVEDAVRRYLSMQPESANRHATPMTSSLDELASQMVGVQLPRVSRPPCVLRPGQGVFLDGWMRFFSYRARSDKTIPLLAIDWINFYERLCPVHS